MFLIDLFEARQDNLMPDLISAMAADNIEAGVIWMPMVDSPGYADMSDPRVDPNFKAKINEIFKKFIGVGLEDLTVATTMSSPQDEIFKVIKWLQENAFDKKGINPDRFDMDLPGYKVDQATMYNWGGTKFLAIKDVVGPPPEEGALASAMPQSFYHVYAAPKKKELPDYTDQGDNIVAFTGKKQPNQSQSQDEKYASALAKQQLDRKDESIKKLREAKKFVGFRIGPGRGYDPDPQKKPGGSIKIENPGLAREFIKTLAKKGITFKANPHKWYLSKDPMIHGSFYFNTNDNFNTAREIAYSWNEILREKRKIENFKKMIKDRKYRKVSFRLSPKSVRTGLGFQKSYEDGLIELRDIMPRRYAGVIKTLADLEEQVGPIKWGTFTGIPTLTNSYNRISNLGMNIAIDGKTEDGIKVVYNYYQPPAEMGAWKFFWINDKKYRYYDEAPKVIRDIRKIKKQPNQPQSQDEKYASALAKQQLDRKDESIKKLREAKEETLVADPLPYGSGDLEPVLSKDNVDYHYNVLTKGYVNRYNKGEGDPKFNYGGAKLHNLFWTQLQSPKRSNKPVGSIKELIETHHEDYDNFKKEMLRMAMTIQGSGWVYLAKNGSIKTILNQSYKTDILLLIDMWEHSFMDYISAKDAKKKYIENMMNIINWDSINGRL